MIVQLQFTVLLGSLLLATNSLSADQLGTAIQAYRDEVVRDRDETAETLEFHIHNLEQALTDAPADRRRGQARVLLAEAYSLNQNPAAALPLFLDVGQEVELPGYLRIRALVGASDAALNEGRPTTEVDAIFHEVESLLIDAVAQHPDSDFYAQRLREFPRERALALERSLLNEAPPTVAAESLRLAGQAFWDASRVDPEHSSEHQMRAAHRWYQAALSFRNLERSQAFEALRYQLAASFEGDLPRWAGRDELFWIGTATMLAVVYDPTPDSQLESRLASIFSLFESERTSPVGELIQLARHETERGQFDRGLRLALFAENRLFFEGSEKHLDPLAEVWILTAQCEAALGDASAIDRLLEKLAEHPLSPGQEHRLKRWVAAQGGKQTKDEASQSNEPPESGASAPNQRSARTEPTRSSVDKPARPGTRFGTGVWWILLAGAVAGTLWRSGTGFRQGRRLRSAQPCDLPSEGSTARHET